MATPNPSPSPAEAPKNLGGLHETTKQKSFIDELAKSHGLTEPEKQKFTEKYQKEIDRLAEKYKDKKDIVIAEINEILQTFKDSLQHEKNDDDDLTEFSPNTPDKDITDADTDKKLGEKEIDEHIKQLSGKIEAKLNAPVVTPPESPKEEVPPAIKGDIQDAQEFFANKGVKIDTATTQKSNWLKSFFDKMVLQFYNFLEGFGIDVRGAKARLEGYKDHISKQKVEETFKVLGEYMGGSVNGITDIKDKEALIGKMEGLGLPLLHGDNLLAGPIMKIIFTGEESAWEDLPEDFDQDILKAVRGKYLTLKDNPKALGGMNTLQKLKEIFTIEEDETEDYILRYEVDQGEKDAERNKPIIEPVRILTEPEKRAEEEKQKITELEEAQKVDKELVDAYKITDPEEYEEKISDAQEKVDAIKKREKIRMLADYEDTKKKGLGLENELKLINQQLPKDLNKIKQKEKEIEKFETTLSKIKEEISSIFDATSLTTDEWTYKGGVSAEKVLLARIHIGEIVKDRDTSDKGQIAVDGTSELEPLDYTDPNNVLYKNGKLYQRDKSQGDRYRELIYKDKTLQLEPEPFFRAGTANFELIGKNPRQVAEAGYKILPYSEASEKLKDLTPEQRGQDSNQGLEWIYIEPEYFAGKLRNIKIN